MLLVGRKLFHWIRPTQKGMANFLNDCNLKTNPNPIQLQLEEQIMKIPGCENSTPWLQQQDCSMNTTSALHHAHREQTTSRRDECAKIGTQQEIAEKHAARQC
jgi:hypothetical protein